MPADLPRAPEAPAPGLPVRLVHPADSGRVRCLWVATDDGLGQALRCDACRQTLCPTDVRPATPEETRRWFRSPAIPAPASTGQYL